MTYENYLILIDNLSKSNNKELLETLKKEIPNPNIIPMLEPKIENLIAVKLSNTIKKIIRDLGEIFSDNNYLDLTLVNFKKDITFIKEIASVAFLSNETKNKLNEKIKQETKDVYDILIKEANKIDQTGVLSMTINYNKIKWGDDNNEL